MLLRGLQLSAQISNQDRPHLRICSQQDLQILIVQEFDLAAHVHVQAVHFVQIVADLRETVISPRRGLLRNSRRGCLRWLTGFRLLRGQQYAAKQYETNSGN